MNRNRIGSLALAAMFLAAGQILPFITGQIPQIGKMLSPMHYPILLCGFFCGWRYGAIVGFICPLLRSVLFGMPVMFPSAVGMAFELMTYGAVSGYLAKRLGCDRLLRIYLILIVSMIVGRIVWGLAQIVLLSISGSRFTFAAFIAGALTNAVPGIVLQLLILPFLIYMFKNRKTV